MGQDVVKSITLNGKLLQTGRDTMSEGAIVGLAGFPRSARVEVLWRQQDERPESAQVLARGAEVAVVPGLVLTTRVRGV